MPKFTYIAKDHEGKTYKDVVEAHNQQSVVDRLQKQDYFIVSIKELTVSVATPSPLKNKKLKFKRNKVKLIDLLAFSRQLATMLEAGVTLIRSLDVICPQIQSKQLYMVLTQVKKEVEGGQALSISVAKHPKVFNQFWISLIEVGEASGTIPTVLNKLNFYMEQQAKFKSVIISGIIYPAILFTVSMGAVLFFALFVGPRFESIFTSMGAELPLITRILLAVFKYVKEHIFLLVGTTVGSIMLIKQYIKTYNGRTLWEKIMFRMPAVGDVYKNIIVERFTSQMAILIESGVPILYALDITEKLVDNNTCALIISGIKEGVKGGELLVASMERTDFFPSMAVQMIMVGEETGELSKMLNHVAKYYQENVETFMHRFATIIEPFMLVFMGTIIGTIVTAMFLPMFNISQLGGG